MKISSRTNAGFTGVNLLIVLALGLCGLVAWQWKRETALFQDNTHLKGDIQALTSAKHSLETTLKRLEADIARVDEIRKGLEEGVRTNKSEVARLGRELARSTDEGEQKDKQIAVYKKAIEDVKDVVNQQNALIERRTEEARKAMADRNEFVLKLNQSMKDRNEAIEEYNKLHRQYEELVETAKKFQEALEKDKDKDKK